MNAALKNGYFGELFEAQSYKHLLYFVSSWLLPILILLFGVPAISVGGSSQSTNFMFGSNLVRTWEIRLDWIDPSSQLHWWIGILGIVLLLVLEFRFALLGIHYERTRAKWLLGADIPARPPAKTHRFLGRSFKLPSLPTARELAFLPLHTLFALATFIVLGALLFATGLLLAAPLIAIWQPPASTFSYWRDSLLWTGSEALKFTATSSIVAFIAGIPMLILTLQASNAVARVWRIGAERAFSNDKSSQKRFMRSSKPPAAC